MSVLSQTFLTLVSSHLVAFSFLSAWHNFECLYYFIDFTFFFTDSINTFAGLNEGM